ncbi:MAG TPA: YaaA family protein [Candidatus Saccharimonadales bacterium]|nr:YaaA family protein [Candidatus Saccharimonadales bacterium]
MTILLHSSKTMRLTSPETVTLSQPQLLEKAEILGVYLKTLSPKQLEKSMQLSAGMANKTHALLAAWTSERKKQSIAIDSFIGDIYSGLHASDLSKSDRDYANKTLIILSGLYGCIRPYDGIYPYRLEMAYRFPDPQFSNLYTFWGNAIAACLPQHGLVINVSSAEYSRAVLPFIDSSRVIEPKFLTMNPQTGKPTFVVVHAKIARGAFARWLLTSRIKESDAFPEFEELGYHYDKKLSTPNTPTFVCREFGGKGLSIRLMDTKQIDKNTSL